jgi:peptidoglycan lytic transglycosylase
VIALLPLVLLLATGQTPRPPVPPDPAIAAARAALAGGQPWRASRLLAPALRDSSSRTPAVLLLAAEAAGAWGGWTQVTRLIGDAPWVDSMAGGRGRELLVRAALERQADSVALQQASLAVRDAKRDTRGIRMTLLARAFDRLEMRDSAAQAYREAATLLPAVSDWLTFRAVAVTDDSAARSTLASSITTAVVRDRLPLAEAQARERSGDVTGAAARYAALGSWGDAFRLRYAADSSAPARAALRRELLGFVTGHTGTTDARAAAEVLDSYGAATPAEDLAVGRSLAQSGPAAAAVTRLRRALKAGLGTSEDRFAYASALFAMNRYADAASQYKLVRRPAALAATAAYGRARALVRAGQVSEARSALRLIVHRDSRYADAAAPALLLLADLATDERRDPDARDALLQLARNYPAHRYAPNALFRAAIIAFAAGQTPVAARELDSMARRYPDHPDALAARYWAGRAFAAQGDTGAARARWRDVAGLDPLSYYAAAAAARLGQPAWTPAAAADSFVRFNGLDSAMARSALLDLLGMGRESRWEQDLLVRLADSSMDRLLSTSSAFESAGAVSRGIQLAWRAYGRGAPRDGRTFRLLYPLSARPALEAYARDDSIDASLVAALIRQESMFNPSATSAAGARGLMQVMPAVGRSLASSLGFPLWDPVLLYQPDVNLELGMRHLAELLRRYPQPVRVLAAYNAGTTRVELWSSRVGASDDELFAERIPYRETRDYVRIIQRNQDMYRALYGLGPSGGAPAAGY